MTEFETINPEQVYNTSETDLLSFVQATIQTLIHRNQEMNLNFQKQLQELIDKRNAEQLHIENTLTFLMSRVTDEAKKHVLIQCPNILNSDTIELIPPVLLQNSNTSNTQQSPITRPLKRNRAEECPQQHCNDIIDLNVGGKHITATRSTLMTDSNSMLSAMFNGRHPLTLDRKGYVFIDRNPKYFELILDMLRTGEGVLPRLQTEGERHALQMELNYFCLHDSLAQVARLNCRRASFHQIGNGTGGSGEGQLLHPRSVFIDQKYIYVNDCWNFRVIILNKIDGTQHHMMDTAGTGDGEFGEQLNPVVDESFIYVAECNRLQIFQKNDFSFVSKYVIPIHCPSIAVIDNDRLYLAGESHKETYCVHNMIYIVNKTTGAAIHEFGSYDDVELFVVFGIAVDEEFIYVSESDTEDVHHIHLFCKNSFKFVRKFFVPDKENDNGVNKGLHVDHEFLYVAAIWSPFIMVLRKNDGSFVRKIGSYGQIQDISNVFVDGDLVYVTDSRSHVVHVIKCPRDI